MASIRKLAVAHTPWIHAEAHRAIGPVLLFVTGIAVPLGLLLPRTTLDYARLRACATKLVAIGVRRR